MIAVDLFAGGGGLSEGAEMAGVSVVCAADHNPVACAIYRANHPHADVRCQDLHQADFTAFPAHDLLLAAPCCQGHTRARGKDRPHHDASRSTAWAVVSCLEAHRPAVALVENVVELRSWTLYPSWCDALHRLGYSVAEHVVDAADCEVPQHRRRLLIVLARASSPLYLGRPDGVHRPASGVVDFATGTWSTVDRPGRSAKTLARVASGRARLGARFLTPYYGSGSGLTGRSLDRPLGTVTTRDRWAVIDGDRMRMLTVVEYRRAMGFHDGYRLPAARAAAIGLLGNAVCPPMARWAVERIRESA